VALVVLVLPGVNEGTGHPVLGYLALGAIFGAINAFVPNLESVDQSDLFREGPFRFFFVSREEQRLHIHVRSAEG
jgi:hypothetical protein